MKTNKITNESVKIYFSKGRMQGIQEGWKLCSDWANHRSSVKLYKDMKIQRLY